MIVATAGHIDHGKTTLVKALTGVDTDRLPEEKVRGISIDLGFAYWPLPGVGTVGFVDVPGHERFVHNMLAGVCGIDYIVLVVAADDGIMPQTVEHLHIVDLLHVTRGIAVVTKIDRIERARVEEVVADVHRLLATTALAKADVIRVSATTGEGMGELRERLRTAAAEQVRRHHEGRHFRYAIDRAFTIAGSGTVVTGTVFTGAVSIGDRLEVSPAGATVRVRAIQQHGEPSATANAGERCALNLAGVDVAGIARGDWVVAAAVAAPSQRLDARVQVLVSESHSMRHWMPVHLHLGTADVTARLAIRRGASIAPGETAHARLLLDRPVCALHGDRFILRDQSATRTIGGGIVINPFPSPARRDTPARRSELDALDNSDAGSALHALLDCTPAGVDIAWFGRIYNLTHDCIEVLLRQANAVVVGKDDRKALPQAALSALMDRAVASVAQFHRQSPKAVGISVDDLHVRLAPKLAAATFLAVLREIADTHAIEIAGSTVRIRQHIATANPADDKLWRRVQPALDKAGFTVPLLRDLAGVLRIDETVLRDFLHRKSHTGELVRVTADRFYPRVTLARLAAVAVAAAAATPKVGFSAAQFRDAAQVGRSLAIEILECLDRLGITQRVGDARKIRNHFEPILGPASPPSKQSAPPPPKR